MFKKVAIASLLCVGSASFAMGQDASQNFRVKVPTSISITAPDAVEINHDESDNDQSFPAQSWVVKGNVIGGVTVSFVASTPFTHTTNAEFKRDAKLSLSLGATAGPANWNISQATAETDYAGNSNTATVSASSDGVGRASFDLAVQFITDNYGTFAAGDYESTVVGTVTAN